MGKQRLQPELEPIRFGNDGELVSGKFCAYCGNRNSASDNYCWHCAEYIADQGPDLTSRLARISRRGSTARVDTSSAVNHMIGTQSPNTFGLLFGQFDSEVTATTSSEDSVRPHLPLSVRLAQVRRHVP